MRMDVLVTGRTRGEARTRAALALSEGSGRLTFLSWHDIKNETKARSSEGKLGQPNGGRILPSILLLPISGPQYTLDTLKIKTWLGGQPFDTARFKYRER